MIVQLDEQLFLQEDTKDVLLLEILRQGGRGRYAVKTRPGYRPRSDRPPNTWIAQLKENLAETARQGFKQGLRWKSRQWPMGRREPEVILKSDCRIEWPKSFDDGPAILPLDNCALDFLNHRLSVKLENESNDWCFLEAVVPSMWRDRWKRAVNHRWIEKEQGGGISEIKRIVREEIIHDDFRRLRTWVMFDSDAVAEGQPSSEALMAERACQSAGVPYHMLKRRAIENYLPERAMKEWASDLRRKVLESTTKEKPRQYANGIVSGIESYWSQPQSVRHFVDLKKYERLSKKSGLREVGKGTPADVWRRDSAINEQEISADDWEIERRGIFYSIFASL